MQQAVVAVPQDLVPTARRLTRHLEEPGAVHYWTDFLLSHLAGTAAFAVAASPQLHPDIDAAVRVVAFVACVFLWYRTFAFLHEVVHRRDSKMRTFRTGWNVLAGIPMLCPSFLYTTHLEHHTQSIYGTPEDGEYVPWGASHPAHIVRSLLLSLGVPLLLVFRFAVLGPLSWIVPGVRGWIEERASALVVHETHRRRKPSPGEIRAWKWQEGAASFWVLAVLLAGGFGYVSWRWFLTFLAVTAAISFLNAVRTVLSHRFRNTAGTLTVEDQVGDSVNHAAGGLLVELMCPVGLRFHALHHMLPSLPYHSLSEAHRILMTALPSDSLYRQTNSPGLWLTMRTLWLDAGANHHQAMTPRKGATRRAV